MRKSPARGESGQVHATRSVRESQTVPAQDPEVSSSPHVVVPDLVPAAWLDRLFLASLEPPRSTAET